ncbi:hypothetical protein LJC56_01175 [Christensenellaceae bacterium OttesenSCG-928-K19]|nr:hypothetical protein [Christensenellaceae bacterium OttesenSCG-928-K19]
MNTVIERNNGMNTKSIVEKALETGNGVMRLAPAWVPRSFCRPGRRLRLHPDDYYALGLARGGIDERWFASTTPADNGPGTPEDEGLSYIVADKDGKEKVLLAEAVELLKGEIIGGALYKKYGKWPMFSKFFDNLGPLPHHIHHSDEYAAKVGESGKPEMYFFPAQYNNYGGEFPFTFFGFNPGVTKQQVKDSLIAFTKGDNKITSLSRAYRLDVDTGWDVPPGVLHAPGSLCTYEPQFASDVYAMYQSILYFDHAVPENLLWKNCPQDKIGDFDYLVEVIDWELNVDPDFTSNRFMAPIPATDDVGQAKQEGYLDEWICYKCKEASAKRLTVLPGKTVTVKDAAAYGFIVVQGYGTCGKLPLESPALIRFGQLTNDEYFVTEDAAKAGLTITNKSNDEPLVLLKHFAENPELPV